MLEELDDNCSTCGCKISVGDPVNVDGVQYSVKYCSECYYKSILDDVGYVDDGERAVRGRYR